MSRPGSQPLTFGYSIGEEFPDLDSARRVAIERIRRLLNQEAGWGQPNLDRKVEISDEAGEVLAVVTFREAAGL